MHRTNPVPVFIELKPNARRGQCAFYRTPLIGGALLVQSRGWSLAWPDLAALLPVCYTPHCLIETGSKDGLESV